MKDIIVALVTGGVGLALVFAGYRFGRVILALWGFILGFGLVAAATADITNNGFLSTVLGVVLGLIAGLIFAALAYLYYYVAIILLGAGLGYWLGSGVMAWLGFSPGLATATTGILLGIVAALIFIAYNIPKLFMIGATAIAGAITTIGALLLLANKIPLESYSYLASKVTISNSIFWTVLTIALAIVGAAFQWVTVSHEEVDEWDTQDVTYHTRLHHV